MSAIGERCEWKSAFRQNVAGRIQIQLNETYAFELLLHCCLSKPAKKIASDSVNILPPFNLPSLGGQNDMK